MTRITPRTPDCMASPFSRQNASILLAVLPFVVYPARMNSAISPPPTTEAPITSIQPGGGLCFSLELAWGGCRRWFLRRFFPRYVERMAQFRQGSCANCPHDVIDSRDLKLVRNVCDCSFPHETDPFAWREHSGFARAGHCELLVFSVVLGLAALTFTALGFCLHGAWFAGLALIVPLWLFILSFFRDPQRTIPDGADLLVSPADGTITDLEEVDEPGFNGKAFRVSIFLSVFNVHVNRLPRAGTVTAVRYYPGEFLDARVSGCAVRNEQLWTDLEDGQLGCPIRIKQIAGAIARRIVCWLRPGEEVQRGDRLGMIKFGSRTDLLVPVECIAEVCVKVGQTVHGGSDVLLRLRVEKSSRISS